MAYNYNPTPTEADILAQVGQRESGSNYGARISPATCARLGQTKCTASGAYQFTDATWQMAAAATGVGTQWGSAYQAQPWEQDINALWLLRYAGGDPNASIAWQASAPKDMIPAAADDGIPLVDLTGADANTPTSDLLSQLDTTVAGIIPGMDATGAGVALLLGGAAVLYWLMGRR